MAIGMRSGIHLANAEFFQTRYGVFRPTAVMLIEANEIFYPRM
jgi:hypothetical protein